MHPRRMTNTRFDEFIFFLQKKEMHIIVFLVFVALCFASSIYELLSTYEYSRSYSEKIREV